MIFDVERMKKDFRVVHIIVMILEVLLFVFTSIFTAVALVSTWGHTKLSYALLGLFVIDVVLYLVVYILSCMRAKPEGIKDAISGMKITRKGLKMVYVILSLVISFSSFDNSAISLIAKTAMTWFSLSMAITYIIMQLLVVFIRKQSKKIINRVKKVKEDVYERVAKIKNKRSS